ncbi:MAG: hypothetical protein HYZ54_01985 [Ignavibacteriae bacterium]|nr:hypothetical protein [Ignavibacteriota bacterium]
MKPASEIKSELLQFSGTTQYYRHLLGVLFTDGIKYLADECQCYWLLDLIVSWQTHQHVREQEFQVFKLKVDVSNRTAVVTIEDGNDNIIQTQKIPFTDFPLDSIEIWYSNKVMYLPSEH